MKCTDAAAILDDHAQQRLTAAERCAFDEHMSGCEPCAHAWRAQTALLALPLPATPADLLARALRTADSHSARTPRRARARVAIVGAVLAAGAALATVTAVRLLEQSGDKLPPATSDRGRVGESAHTPAVPPPSPAPGASAASDADSAAVTLEDVESEYFMALRVAPDYPREALDRKLEGDVIVEYTIDDRGAVKNVRAVRSSDPLFEAPALAAASQWKYLPRVTAGKRVAVGGVQTVIRFQLGMPPAPPAGAKTSDKVLQFQLKASSAAPSPSAKAGENATPAPEREHPADYATFDRSMTVAWQRSAADDLRGAELELDELRATYDIDDLQSNQVWAFYGYIYTQYGDYGRAIDAYEKAVAANNAFWPGQWTSLASLYFARHQYDKALRTLLAYKQRSSSGRIPPEVSAMIERLRALGVTEETL